MRLYEKQCDSSPWKQSRHGPRRKRTQKHDSFYPRQIRRYLQIKHRKIAPANERMEVNKTNQDTSLTRASKMNKNIQRSNFSRIVPLTASVLLATLISACHNPEPDTDFDSKVTAAILKNPEIIRQAVEKLAEKEDDKNRKETAHTIAENKDGLSAKPYDIALNDSGAITIVEFSDVQCPHCIEAMPSIDKLSSANKNIRVVIKALPIFGELSEKGSALIFAANRLDGNGYKVYKELMHSAPLTNEKIKEIAAKNKIPESEFDNQEKMKAYATEFNSTRDLAKNLKITGTPAFVVGDQIVFGSNIQTLKSALDRYVAKNS